MEQPAPSYRSAQDRLTRAVRDQMSSFLWAALEGQAERDASRDELARAMLDLEAAEQKMASLETVIAAYLQQYGEIKPPEATSPNGLSRERTKAEKGG